MMQKDAIYIEDFLYFHIKLDFNKKIEFVYDMLKYDASYAIETHINNQVDKTIEEVVTPTMDQLIVSAIVEGDKILSIAIQDNEIYLNSDSLKIIKRYARKMIFDGLVLERIRNRRKSEFEPYRFFRAYKIVGHGSPISMN